MRRLLLCVALAACGKAGEPGKAAGSGDPAVAARATAGDGGARRPEQQVAPPFDVATPPADATRLPDGLAWKSIAEGTGATPGPNDGVKLHYTGWRADGTTFATTQTTGKPVVRWLYALAPGFTEGLRQLKVGGKAMLWVPAALGYPAGQQPAQPEALAYEVELLAVIAAPPTPPDVAAIPADARRAPSGVAWKVVASAPAGAERPRGWDKVTFAYTGWDAAGRIVDSSEVQGRPVTLPADHLPAAFADVVPALAVGDRARLWFPATMMGAGATRATGTVCFEVTLDAVIHLSEPPAAPPDVAAPPADARRTPAGVPYRVLASGTGAAHPSATDQVTVHLTAWTTDGARFDSTVTEGAPRQLRVNAVIPGLSDVLRQMVVGDHWRAWIPADLAYRGAPGRPAGVLVYDVELLHVAPTTPHAPRGRTP